MKSKMTKRYEAAEAATASTTAASTGSDKGPMKVVVGLLVALMVAMLIWAAVYTGPEWEPLAQELVRNDGYDRGTGLAIPVEEDEPVEEPEPLDLSTEYRVSCQANTIIAGSYGACKNHASCQLSNEEMMAMYIAGKTAVIVCKKYEMLELYNGINEELEMLKQLEEAPLDDAFEEKTDTMDSMRITS